MEILLSKLIPLFIYPAGLLFCVLLAATGLLFARRLKAARILLAAALLVVIAAGNDWTAYTLIRSLENDHPPLSVEQTPDADVIVVLGGGLGLPIPPRLHPDLGPSADRLLHGFRLYRAGKAPRILLTGGNVFPEPGLESESVYARELLETWGVPASAVELETESRNTIENARYSARILKKRGWDDVLLVTSATHMHRALLAFRSAGIDAVPAPTDFIAVDSHRPEILGLVPNAGALSGTTHALHEYLGRLYYRIRL